MKVIIVGAGVSGLSTYLLLRKLLPSAHRDNIEIYESYNPSEGVANTPGQSLSRADGLTDSTAVVGNSIGLSPNSVRLLKYVDSGLYDIFKSRGYASETYKIKTARGHTLAVAPATDGKTPVEYTVSCPRYGLWECLRQVVPQDVIQYRKVTDIDLSGAKPVVEFADGGREVADVVVGADGVRSVVKRAIFGEEDEREYSPRYEGFCGVGAFVNADLPEEVIKSKSMVFTFGPNSSFGYCSAAPESQRLLGWWSNWPVSDIPASNLVDEEVVRRQLRERHGTWKDPTIQMIIEKMSTNRIYPIWTTPNLPFWGKSGAVLLGDAAHTVKATSGQGATLALEDCVTFSLLLSHYIAETETPGSQLTVHEAIQLTSQGLYEIRNPRVASVRDQARSLYSNKRISNIIFEYLFYAYLYIWTNYPRIGAIISGDWTKWVEIHQWDAEESVSGYLKRKKNLELS